MRTSKSRFLKTSYIPRTSLLTASPVVMLGVKMAILVMNFVESAASPSSLSVQAAKGPQELRFDLVRGKVLFVAVATLDSHSHVHRFIASQQVDRLGHVLRIATRQDDSGVAYCFRSRRGIIRDDGNFHGHRFDQRQAKSLMFAGGDKNICQKVAGPERGI